MPAYTNTRDTLNDPTGQKTQDKLVAHELTSLVEDGTTELGAYALRQQTTQETVDFPNLTSIGTQAFQKCSAIQALQLRNNQICTLNHMYSQAISNIAAGHGGVYVNDSILSSYKSNSTWRPYSHLIFPISEYPRASLVTITDTWAQIIAASSNGTYATKYNVGDTAYLEINNTNYMMQLVAKNADDKVSGGTANMTWILKNTYGTHKMSTDMTGGWESSDPNSMRNWLHNTVLGLLPAALQEEGAIKEVNKTYWDATANDNAGALKTSHDKIWIPSSREMCLTGTYLKETSGVQYDDIFSDGKTRIMFNGVNGSTTTYWVRSALSSMGWVAINNLGNGTSVSFNSTCDVVFGFCI